MFLPTLENINPKIAENIFSWNSFSLALERFKLQIMQITNLEEVLTETEKNFFFWNFRGFLSLEDTLSKKNFQYFFIDKGDF